MSNDKMNWATIAPESRLYKGKNLYRWDVSPGLEHHCGICATPLHNARAKNTCLGKHVEPCYRFHQQLYFVGKSHECFGCNSSDEMHHSRHKDILKIVRQITALNQGNPSTPSSFVTYACKSRDSATGSPTDTSSETFSVDGIKLTRRERKKAKKAGNGAKDKNNLEIFATDELDFISEAIHLTKHESKGAWAGTYNYGERQHDAAADDEILMIDVDAEEKAEHLEDFAVKHISMMTPRQRKTAKKYSTSVGHTNFRGGSRKFSPGISNSIYDGVDPRIFSRLGVEVANPTLNSRARKELITKLVAAVKEDLDIIEREESESAMRREGFWRWAGRTAFNMIARTRENLDWATGQKIEKFDHRRGSSTELAGGEYDGEQLDAENSPPTDRRLQLLSPDCEPPIPPVLEMTNVSKEKHPVNAPKTNSSVKASSNPTVSNWFESPKPTNTSSTSNITISAWAPNPLKFDAEVKPETLVVEAEEQNKENEATFGWEVVKRGKGVAQPQLTKKQSSLTEPKSVYRKLSEPSTISLK